MKNMKRKEIVFLRFQIISVCLDMSLPEMNEEEKIYFYFYFIFFQTPVIQKFILFLYRLATPALPTICNLVHTNLHFSHIFAHSVHMRSIARRTSQIDSSWEFYHHKIAQFLHKLYCILNELAVANRWCCCADSRLYQTFVIIFYDCLASHTIHITNEPYEVLVFKWVHETQSFTWKMFDS